VLDVGAEILDDDVSPGHQALEDLDAARGLEIERHRALVAVEVQRVETAPREITAAILSGPDLYDVGAHVGQLAHAGGAGPRTGEVDDGVWLER
jgi:hypothetical protein